LLKHLIEIQTQAENFMEKMKPEMMKNMGITEELKVKDQMQWVKCQRQDKLTSRKLYGENETRDDEKYGDNRRVESQRSNAVGQVSAPGQIEAGKLREFINVLE
ncbi:TnpV protein, partial [Gemella sp. zg-1178]